MFSRRVRNNLSEIFIDGYIDALHYAAWEVGLVNMHVPEKYGGPGLHALDGVIVGEELAYGCTGMMTAMEGNSLASAPVILAGSDEQQVLRPIICGNFAVATVFHLVYPAEGVPGPIDC